MKKLFVILTVLLLWGQGQVMARDNEPDFNFPQDVTKQAEADLKTALSKGDGQQLVDALVRSSLAKSSITIENMSEIVEDIDRVARKESRPDIRALLYHLEARVMHDYTNNFTPLDRRNPRYMSHNADVKDKYAYWDSYHFATDIDSLVSLSLKEREALLQYPVTSYKEILRYNDLGTKYIPTLYHFLNYRGQDLVSSTLEKKLQIDLETAMPDNTMATVFAKCAPLGNWSSYQKEYQAVYEEFADVPEGGLPLSYLSGDKHYDTFRQYVKRFPKSIYANSIRNSITYIERKWATVDYEGHLNSKFSAHAQQAQVKVKVRVRNVNDVSVRIYRMPDDFLTEAWPNKVLTIKDMTLQAEQQVHFDGSTPFESSADIIFAALPHGRYTIVPVYKNNGKDVIPEIIDDSKYLAIYDLATFNVSEAEPRQLIEKGNEVNRVNRIIVVDDATGKPVQGATVTIDKENWNVKTDRNGSVDLPKNLAHYLSYRPIMGDDKFAPWTNFRHNSAHTSQSNSASVFTDLGIYRPGETMKWACILYEHSSDTRNVLPNREVHITIYDANHKVIDQQTATTDEFGRVEGSYVIPTGRLLGTYSIHMGLNERSSLGSRSFQVSEYKTPTFFVEFPKDELAFQPGQPITVTGRAATYSGMPLADAEVKLKLTKRSWDWRWWYYRPLMEPADAVADTIVRTDAQGQFQVTFDNQLFIELGNSRHYSCFYNYIAHAQVTDATGESQEATAGFHIGHKREVRLNTTNIDHNNIAPLRLPLTVNNTDTTQQSLTLLYRLTRPESTDTIRGTFPSDNPTLDLTRLPSGQYYLRVTLADDDNCYTSAFVNLYHKTDAQAPIADQALWIPDDGYYIDEKNIAHVTIGTSTPEAHIYYVASGRVTMLGDGWIDRSKPGFQEFTFRVPAKADEVLNLKFMAFHHSKYFEKEISMVVPACQQTLKVTATSFRDKLVPGKPERWQFALKDKNGKPQRGALMLEMFDKALNSLSDNTWSFSPGYYLFNSIITSHSDNIGKRSINNPWQGESLSNKDMQYFIPNFYTYDRRFWQGCDNPFMEYHMLRSAMADGSARPMPRVLKEEVVVERQTSNAMAAPSQAEQPDVDQKKLEKVEMRLSDVKTALWQPMLTSDEQGNLSLEFDAPNFNTTWLVQAIGFTTGLASNIFNAEVLTQKPIMVKSSLPRFVRQGDVTRLAANLQNASDHTIQTQALIEVFDPRTNVVYAQQSFNETIESMQTKPLMMSWTVPDTIPYVGFRVRAVGDDFGDGEQVMLPVLTAISPIIETNPFFIDAGQSQYTFTMPDVPDNARVTLEYSDNPVWQCVTALPSIFSDNSHVATSIAHSLYALNVARGVANSQPIIAEAFRYWQENAKDSMLVSALDHNSDLKIGNLVASPWLRTSERQTLQMQQLANYFDADKARAEHDRLVNALASLQQPDGGFTWYVYPGCKSSLWATGEVLELIGNLRQLGYQPADSRLDQMMQRALDYYDKGYVAESKKKENKKAIFSTFAYTRSLHDNVPMSKDARKLYNNTIKKMAKQWGKLDLSLTSKAFYAMTLERSGKHKEAARIAESLRQFASVKPEIGMYWDQYRSQRWFTPSQVAATSVILRAMNTADPRQHELDQIRKWMLLSKRTTDWGGSSLAADAVQSLLSTGSQWIERGQMPIITIDGKPVELDRFDAFVGYSRRDVDAHAGSLFSIQRASTATPAWGGIYWQYSLPMQDVQAASVREVSISKEIVALDAAESPTTAAIRVGDKVRVRLIITCDQAMDYVQIADERASCLEPADKTSGYRYQEGIGYYRETRDSATNLFIDRLPKGTHIITYDAFATATGTFASGVATLQSQQAPEMTAHTAGQQLVIAQ